jgi:hypothetical protein
MLRLERRSLVVGGLCAGVPLLSTWSDLAAKTGKTRVQLAVVTSMQRLIGGKALCRLVIRVVDGDSVRATRLNDTLGSTPVPSH